jgi:hypothetical protein
LSLEFTLKENEEIQSRTRTFFCGEECEGWLRIAGLFEVAEQEALAFVRKHGPRVYPRCATWLLGQIFTEQHRCAVEREITEAFEKYCKGELYTTNKRIAFLSRLGLPVNVSIQDVTSVEEKDGIIRINVRQRRRLLERVESRHRKGENSVSRFTFVRVSQGIQCVKVLESWKDMSVRMQGALMHADFKTLALEFGLLEETDRDAAKHVKNLMESDTYLMLQ